MKFLFSTVLSAVWCVGLKLHRNNPIHGAFSTNKNFHGDVDYSVEKVSNKSRALDVKVFRGFSISAREYIYVQHRHGKHDISVAQAIDFLMCNYDENGNYIMRFKPVSYFPEAYFAAIYDGKEQEKIECFSRQNGVIGVISAQFRLNAPFNDGVSSSSELATVAAPHVYVANMRVHNEMQKRGLGQALLSSAIAHTLTLNKLMDEKIPLVLSVENDNLVAIRLYKRLGFEIFDKNQASSLLMLWPQVQQN